MVTDRLNGVRLVKCRYRNFFNVEDQTVRYDGMGLCCVCGANGSGKTALYVEGPYYLLFGESFEYGRKPGKKVVRRGCRDMSVEGTLTDGNSVIRVVRSRNDPEHGTGLRVWVDGNAVTAGRTDDTQEILNRLTGLDPLTFPLSRMFTTGMLRFPDLPDPVKKEVFDQMLGNARFAEALERVTKEVSALAPALTAARVADELARDRATSAASRHAAAVARNDGWEESVRAERERVARALSDCRSRAEETRAAVAAAESEVAAGESEVADGRVRVAALAGPAEQALERELALERDARVEEATAESELRRLKSLREAGKCPTCSQDVAAVTVRLEAVAELVAAARETVRKASERVAAARRLSARVKESEDRLAERERELARKRVAAANDRATLGRLEAEASALEGKLVEASANPHAGEVAEAAARLEAARGEEEAAAAELERLRTEEADLAALQAVFGPKGAKADVVTAACPFLNDKASEVAELLETPIRVSFGVVGPDEPYAGTLRVDVDNPLGAEGYHGNSAGERRRVDVIVLFSFLALSGARAGNLFPQVFFDEAFENLDQWGQESLARLLVHLSRNEESTFVITHVAHRLTAFADTVVEVSGGRVTVIRNGKDDPPE